MRKDQIIKNVKQFIDNTLKDETTGHDNWHAIRVYRVAKEINKKERGDDFVICVSALLHDIVDRKMSRPYTFQKLDELLEKFGICENDIKEIMFVIKYVSFSSKQPRKKSLELKIVQDADKLDALGAIGIARTFAYGGKDNRKIYDPDLKPNKRFSKQRYKLNKGHSINHFYEKLLKLKDLMNTKTGRKIAKERHRFIENFLTEFLNEWQAKV